MSGDKEKEEASVQNDGSSEFSDLEPPSTQAEESSQVQVEIRNPPEPKDDSREEEKEEIGDNEKEEGDVIEQGNIAKVAEDVEEGKTMIATSEDVKENETPKPIQQEQKMVQPSPLVHIGATRNSSLRQSEPTASCFSSNRTLLIAGLCLCLFVIVVVQGITLGLVLSQKAASEKETTADNGNDGGDVPSGEGPPRIPTLLPTTMPSVTPTIQNDAFRSIANEPGAILLNQVSNCDECTEYVKVDAREHYLPWDARMNVTELEVNSNGYVNIYCWNGRNCGMIDIVTLDLFPSAKGSVYLLWEQDSQTSVFFDVESQQLWRTSTLTISFEEVLIFGVPPNSPYQVNAQVKISQGEITICFGAGNTYPIQLHEDWSLQLHREPQL